MQRRILRSCALFIVALCVRTSLSPVIAQQPQQTREGIIASFAPVVEKLAPSVVTVSTTQTVWHGLTAYPFSDDALRQFFGGTRSAKTRQTDAARPRLRCDRNKQPVKSAKDPLAMRLRGQSRASV